jgi:FO synthase
MARTIAVARLILGSEVNLQAPPNLSPHDHRLFLQAGINDWGGISPITKDYVNPEAAWPHVAALERTCASAGFVLRPRLCVYPEYVTPTWIDSSLIDRVTTLANGSENGHAATM